MNEEVFSGIKVLIAVAQADGCIDERERAAIEGVLKGVALPGGATLAGLLGGNIDLGAELGRIVSADARTRTYRAACAIAHADGVVCREEGVICSRIAAELGIEMNESIDLFVQSVDAVMPRLVATRIDDSVERDAAVDAAIASASVSSAALATTLPVGDHACIFDNDVRLAREVGAFYGRIASDAFWRTFVTNLRGAPAPWFGMSSLMAIIVGAEGVALTAYATTYAVGRATAHYFEKEEAIDHEALRCAFAEAREAGCKTAHDASEAIAAERSMLEEAKATLAMSSDHDSAKTLVAVYDEIRVAAE